MIRRASGILVLLCVIAGLAVVSASAPSRADDPPPRKAPKGPKQVKIGKITWYVSYDDAARVARKANKPLWLHFGENPG